MPDAADLAAIVRVVLGKSEPFAEERAAAHDALDALVARCEQAEGERDEWKERLELTLDSCPACGGSGQVEVPERNMCATCDGSGVVSAAWMYERIEQLERERDEAQRLANTMEHERDWEKEVVHSDLLERAEAAERRVAELEAAIRDAYLADNDGAPIDCINLARGVILAALALGRDQ